MAAVATPPPARRPTEVVVAAAEDVDGVAVVARRADAPDAKALLALSDRARQKLGDAVVALGTAVDGRVHLVVNVAPAVVERGVKAGEVVRAAAAVVGGGGGGRDTMAQAGGRDPERLDEALDTARSEIERALRGPDHADPGARPRRCPLRLCGLGPLRHPGHAALAIERPGHARGLARAGRSSSASWRPSCVVVGLPLTLAGEEGAAGGQGAAVRRAPAGRG